MDTYSLIISAIAVLISFISFIKTSYWFHYKLSIRQVAQSNFFTESGVHKVRLKFIFACSGNENVYVDQLYLNQGNDDVVSSKSKSADVKKLLKPGDIEEFIQEVDGKELKHGQSYTLIFTLLSSSATQSHVCMGISTKPSNTKNVLIDFEKMGSASYSHSPFNTWVCIKQWRARVKREQCIEKS
ncbi:TPA: hypothetical protein NK235_002797 [Vibrio parahaemolyticus]|nr:hypothetical protein [Vibrio parahaemolyticus]